MAGGVLIPFKQGNDSNEVRSTRRKLIIVLIPFKQGNDSNIKIPFYKIIILS